MGAGMSAFSLSASHFIMMAATKMPQKERRPLLFGLIAIVYLVACILRWSRYSNFLIGEATSGVVTKFVTDAGSFASDQNTFQIDSFTSNSGTPGFIVLLTCSDGFFDMWLNWLAFFTKLRIPNLPVHLFAEDETTYLRCRKLVADMTVMADDGDEQYIPDLSCLSWKTVFPESEEQKKIGALGYRQQGYMAMMSHRPSVVQYELEKGHDVIFSDIDVIWKKNPLPFFQDRMAANIWAQRDGTTKEGRDYLCPGFMVFRSDPTTIALIDKWRSKLEGEEKYNQKPFNKLLQQNEDKMNIVAKTLPPELFVTGDLYFKQMTDDERAGAVIVHGNGGKSGYQTKVDRFKKFGLWRPADLNFGGKRGSEWEEMFVRSHIRHGDFEFSHLQSKLTLSFSFSPGSRRTMRSMAT
ncbi:hypothetical protein ACHAWF_010755 [Thalassiosira exigua]